MIEEEEKIVNYLEDIDSTFSSINRRLKEILTRISDMEKINSKVIKDFGPLMKMFNIKQSDPLLHKEEDLVYNENSSVILKTSSPKNPFMDTASSELLNRTIFNKFEDSVKISSSSVLEECKYTCSNVYYEDSSSSDIVGFDLEKIPDLFKNENHLFEVYNFIKERKSVKFEEIIENFDNVDCEKIVIYLDLLRNKKFIKRRDNLFYVTL